MQEFNRLLDIMEKLLGPDGCPWDRKQTLMSLRQSVIEEVYELVEAINIDDNVKILEELGDLMLNVLFFCKLGEKENRFSIVDVFNVIISKLIRRHPHVFGDKKIEDIKEVLKQWEDIKESEKHWRTSALDGIPKESPSLLRAQKILQKFCKKNYIDMDIVDDLPLFYSEEDLGKILLALVLKANKMGVDVDVALRKRLSYEEKKFREWEKS